MLLHASSPAGSPAWPGRRAGDQDLAESLVILQRNRRPSGTALSARARSLRPTGSGTKNREIALVLIRLRSRPSRFMHITSTTSLESAPGTALTIYAMLERGIEATSAHRLERIRWRILVTLRELREVLALSQSVLLIRAREDRLEGRDCRCVELAVNPLREPETCRPTRHCVAVRPIGRHRVVGVGDRNDLDTSGMSMSPQPVRIALPSIRSWWWRTIVAISE